MILRSIAACLVLALAGCTTYSSYFSRGSGSSQAESKSDSKAEAARKPAPDFMLKDVDGKPVKLSDYKGKVVLLNFWATWCGPCKIEIPWFMEFEQQYKDKNFAVLGVSLDEEGWDAVKPYIAEKKINYRVVVGTEQVAQLYGDVDSLPTTFMIDREGRIAAVHVGLVSKNDYIHDIDNLLGTATRASLFTRPR